MVDVLKVYQQKQAFKRLWQWANWQYWDKQHLLDYTNSL